MRINLLIDLSGTLHIGDVACPGAVAALEKLRRARPISSKNTLHLRFCSNTTKESTSDLQQRLFRAGFHDRLIPKESILTSLEASKKLARQTKWKPLLLLSPSAQETFLGDEGNDADAFFARSDTPPSKMSPTEKKKLEQCDSVLVGLAPDLFTSEWMDEAFRILSSEYEEQSGKHLIATHRALYYRPATSAPLSLGPGAYVAALEAACQRSAADTIVCGKPSQTFYESCLESLRGEGNEEGEDEEQRNIVIGDDIEADLGGAAIEMGLERILVKTGKYRQGDEDRSSKPVQVFPSFAEFVESELFGKGVVV